MNDFLKKNKSSLKRFDVHRKTKSEVQSQTISGAVITILASIIVLLLISNEFRTYLKVENISRMVPDRSVGLEAIDIQFMVAFKSVKCEKISFHQSVTRGTLHTHDEGKIVKSNSINGCTLEGTIGVDKVDGNFRFSIVPELGPMQHKIINGIPIQNSIKAMDLSHQIHYLRFIPRDLALLDDESINDIYPKDSDSTFTTPLIGLETNKEIGLLNYAVRVVSIQDHYLNRTIKHTTKLSILDREVGLDHIATGVSISGYPIHNELGLLFSYDFYPIMLETTETRVQTLFQFLTGLCAILGGTITVLSLIDKFVHESTKGLLGKQD